jgi:hypothetical protein
LDGVRGDALRAANAPHLHGLAASGVAAWDAYAGGPPVGDPAMRQATLSGPGWSSVLIGVWRDKHRVADNTFANVNLFRYPHVFARIKAVRPTAYLSSIVQWAPLNIILVRMMPGIASFTAEFSRDDLVTDAAVEHLANANPDVLFVHLGETDWAGHGEAFSRSAPSYMAAIERADARVGRLLAALRARPGYATENWLVLVTTDHGGNRGYHGGQSPAERQIWIIANGAGLPAATVSPGPGHTVVARTVLHHLGIVPQPDWGLADAEPFGFPRATASFPSPRDGEDQVERKVTLRWQPGAGAVAHHVYFANRPELGPGDLLATTREPTLEVGHRAVDTDYFWRIDTVTEQGELPGDVWRFRTAGDIYRGLVLHLDLEGHTLDVSSRGNHGLPRGAPRFARGTLGEGMEFGTNADAVVLGRPADLDFGADQDFSVAFWIRSQGWAGEPVFLANRDHGADSVGWLFAGQGDGRQWRWTLRGEGGARLDHDRAGHVADGLWHLLAATHDRDGDVVFYQDGVRRAAGTLVGQGSIDSGLPTAIGQDGTLAWAHGLTALLDDVRIWRRLLADHEVARLWGAGPGAAWRPLGAGTEAPYRRPELQGLGPLTGGSSNSISLLGARPLAPAAFLGGARLAHELRFGALLVPVPQMFFPTATDAEGGATLAFTWPDGIPAGEQLFFQAWLVDGSMPSGLAASDGLAATAR